MTLVHPCAEEHPWHLADCPLELLAAMWNDSLYLADGDAARDGDDLLTAWHAKQLIPAPRAEGVPS